MMSFETTVHKQIDHPPGLDEATGVTCVAALPEARRFDILNHHTRRTDLRIALLESPDLVQQRFV